MKRKQASTLIPNDKFDEMQNIIQKTIDAALLLRGFTAMYYHDNGDAVRIDMDQFLSVVWDLQENFCQDLIEVKRILYHSAGSTIRLECPELNEGETNGS